MEQITLYHKDVPISRYVLKNNCFSIGSGADNDLVLADDRVAEQQVVLYKTRSGSWCARTFDEIGDEEIEFNPGTKITLAPFSFELKCSMSNDAGPHVLSQEPKLGLVGSSLQIQILKMNIANLAHLSAPVLIIGETGTGKELVSRGLHLSSPRSQGPFVAVNCGGLTDSLMEDTLFGHKRGAFTGAMDSRAGVFERADKGILFMDEIGEMPISQQAALLRVLDDKKVLRIGDDQSKQVDFRLVCATNRNLEKLVERGDFRRDLYHRISTLILSTSPLREHPKDIEELSKHFLSEMAEEVGFKTLDKGALEKLQQYDWPGNARELRNVLYRAGAFTSSDVLSADSFNIQRTYDKPKEKALRLDKLPDFYIEEAMVRAGGNVAAAARTLGVPRSSLRDKVNRICDSSNQVKVNRRAG